MRARKSRNGTPPHLPIALHPSMQMWRVIWFVCGNAASSASVHGRRSLTRPDTSRRHAPPSTWRTSFDRIVGVERERIGDVGFAVGRRHAGAAEQRGLHPCRSSATWLTARDPPRHRPRDCIRSAATARRPTACHAGTAGATRARGRVDDRPDRCRPSRAPREHRPQRARHDGDQGQMHDDECRRCRPWRESARGAQSRSRRAVRSADRAAPASRSPGPRRSPARCRIPQAHRAAVARRCTANRHVAAGSAAPASHPARSRAGATGTGGA